MKKITNRGKSGLRIISVICFIGFSVLVAACDNTQGMMQGRGIGRSMDMGNWNWLQILISLGIGFLLGYLVARRKR